MTIKSKDINRFTEKVSPEPNTGCWLWTAALFKNGYGAFGYEKKVMGAHRFSYLVYVGSIPEDTQLDHLCRMRCCVNPRHLEAVSSAENTRRGDKACRLSEAGARAIYYDGRDTQQIADSYGICRRHVQNIQAGNKWRGVAND